jgi:hypothetical protein
MYIIQSSVHQPVRHAKYLSTSRYISQCVTLYISVRHAIYLSASRFISQCVTLYISVRHALYISTSRYVSQYVTLRISLRHDVSLRSVAGLVEWLRDCIISRIIICAVRWRSDVWVGFYGCSPVGGGGGVDRYGYWQNVIVRSYRVESIRKAC